MPHLSVWDPRQRESIFDADVLTGEDATTVLEFERFLEMPLEFVIRNEVPGRLPEGHQANTTKPYTGNVFTGSRDRRLLHPTGHKLIDDDGNAIHPLLLVDSVELEGPIVTAEDRRKREGFWPADLESEAEIRECLGRFAERAWRRPVEPEEIDRYLAVVRGVRGAGESPRSAYQAAFVGVLASKNFFYLEQGSAEEPRAKLTDWELASRLSYSSGARCPTSRSSRPPARAPSASRKCSPRRSRGCSPTRRSRGSPTRFRGSGCSSIGWGCSRPTASSIPTTTSGSRRA